MNPSAFFFRRKPTSVSVSDLRRLRGPQNRRRFEMLLLPPQDRGVLWSAPVSKVEPPEAVQSKPGPVGRVPAGSKRATHDDPSTTDTGPERA